MDTIVMYPTIGISHIMPMVELAKTIHTHDPSFPITILITPSPSDGDAAAATESALAAVTAAIPSITFTYLSPQPLSSTPASAALNFDLARLNNPLLHRTLRSFATPIAAFIADLFNAAALEVTVGHLNIPTFVYYTSGASILAAILYFPTFHRKYTLSLKDIKGEILIDFPGSPPVPKSHLPDAFLDRTNIIYNNFVYVGDTIHRAAGIIVNTFEALEPRALEAISKGLCVAPGTRTPPVFCVGPLVGGARDGKERDAHEWTRWLDMQPRGSVVFLCFGSQGVFTAEQLRAAALGLERSGQRFLWRARGPGGSPEEKLLPEGFVERTKGRGMVVWTWMPQFEVLSHGAVGGFVTHCGWNSVLEAVWAGVPMVAWPLYAEQRLNKLFLVEGSKVALPLEWGAGGFVTADELERRVLELMTETASGLAVRKRVRAMSKAARAAVGEGGSSRAALDKLARLWKSR